MQGATPKEILNFEEALVNVGGSQELLGELAQALKQELPRLMGATRKGLDDGDATAVSRAAHSLKGSIYRLYFLQFLIGNAELKTENIDHSYNFSKSLHLL